MLSVLPRMKHFNDNVITGIRFYAGCKWSFCQLRQYFQQVGISDWLLWQKISVIVVLTLISQVEHIPPTINCFEFFGFDILIDNELKPWLLEVKFPQYFSMIAIYY